MFLSEKRLARSVTKSYASLMVWLENLLEKEIEREEKGA